MDRTPRLCLSAGHGYESRANNQTDPGAGFIGPGDEADIVLAMSKDLTADFKNLFAPVPGAYVMLRNAGPYYRADDDARSHACDTFIESHTDAASKTANGTSVLYEGSGSRDFAEHLSKNVSGALGTHNDGAKYRSDLAVLQPVRGDSLKIQVIIEWVFGTNSADVAKMRSHWEQGELAFVNTVLVRYGWPTVTKLPRKWGTLSKATWKRRLKSHGVI